MILTMISFDIYPFIHKSLVHACMWFNVAVNAVSAVFRYLVTHKRAASSQWLVDWLALCGHDVSIMFNGSNGKQWWKRKQRKGGEAIATKSIKINFVVCGWRPSCRAVQWWRSSVATYHAKFRRWLTQSTIRCIARPLITQTLSRNEVNHDVTSTLHCFSSQPVHLLAQTSIRPSIRTTSVSQWAITWLVIIVWMSFWLAGWTGGAEGLRW